jgi:multisubunit Na+/H+ antiporter MnhC subunit
MAERNLMKKLFGDPSQALTTIVIGTNVFAFAASLILIAMAWRHWHPG